MAIQRVLILVLLFLLPLPALALDVPQLRGRVNDYAGMLSPEAASRIERKLAAFERDSTTQIAILTIPSLQGDDIDHFAIQVADTWRIGQKGKDNGVIMILAQKERKVRIEVGMGLQGVLPDITASHIIRDVMRPYLKTGNYDQGIEAGADAIMAATKGEFTASPRTAAPHRHTANTGLAIFLFVAVAIVILGSISRYLGGLAGAAGLPLAAYFSFPGIGLTALLILAAIGFGGGLLLTLLFSGMFGGGGGGGGYFGGGGGYWGGGGGYWGGGSSGGDSGGFSGGGGGFDGGGSSDDY